MKRKRTIGWIIKHTCGLVVEIAKDGTPILSDRAELFATLGDANRAINRSASSPTWADSSLQYKVVRVIGRPKIV